MNHQSFQFVLIAVSIFAWPGFLMAYVGPGAGISLIGSLVGVISAIVLSLVVILFKPIRRILRARKNSEPPANGDAAAGEDN